MIVGLLRVEFRLHGNSSLKDKRRVANSLKQKVRNTFNVALAEIGSEEDMSRLALSVISISPRTASRRAFRESGTAAPR